MNLSEKNISFRAPRGRHGPKLKIRKRAKKLSAAAFKNPNKFFLYVLKGPLQHIKNLSGHFFFSESDIKKGVWASRAALTTGLRKILAAKA